MKSAIMGRNQLLRGLYGSQFMLKFSRSSGRGINFGSLENTSQLAQNALSVLELAGRSDVPVYLGARQPLARPFVDLGGSTFHGRDGLGGAPRPVPRASVQRRSASEAIVEACRGERPPVLLSLAPLTNVALALALEPRLPQLCPELYLMGGTVTAPGNVGPLAEAWHLERPWSELLKQANVGNDPEAAAKVLAAGFRTHVAGLDVTMATWRGQEACRCSVQVGA